MNDVTINPHLPITELDSREDIRLANISLLVMKRRLGLENSTKWDSPGVVVDLPDQENIREGLG